MLFVGGGEFLRGDSKLIPTSEMNLLQTMAVSCHFSYFIINDINIDGRSKKKTKGRKRRKEKKNEQKENENYPHRVLVQFASRYTVVMRA